MLRPLRFIHRGQVVHLDAVAPERTLLEVLREDLRLTGTKEGCGEGDCGACTVVLGELVPPAADAPTHQAPALRYRAINACIRLAHSINGLALWTAQDLHQDPLLNPASPASTPSQAAPAPGAPAPKGLHPVQQAMVDCHGSQCGFCTPGFVMSLFALYQEQPPQQPAQSQPVQPSVPSRACVQQVLSGNLCRCTGYRPIVDAGQRMHSLKPWAVDEAALGALLQSLQDGKPAAAPRGAPSGAPLYLAPSRLSDLLAARARYPEAQVVAGCTDAGLWVTKQHRVFKQVLDVTRAAELRRLEMYPHHLAIGAAVSLSDAFAALVAKRPQLKSFCERFAGVPVRNSGTLGGNIANGSPIGDSMPLLIALGASLVLMSTRGHREVLLEDFYLGYRQNRLAADEILAWIKVPHPGPGELLRAYKVSKRWEDDISAVCLALALDLDEQGLIRAARIGAGGVAATPVRARKTEAALLGRRWSAASAAQAASVLQAEFTPISDMRASAEYRRTVLGALLQRLWLEYEGNTTLDLQALEALV